MDNTIDIHYYCKSLFSCLGKVLTALSFKSVLTALDTPLSMQHPND